MAGCVICQAFSRHLAGVVVHFHQAVVHEPGRDPRGWCTCRRSLLSRLLFRRAVRHAGSHLVALPLPVSGDRPMSAQRVRYRCTADFDMPTASPISAPTSALSAARSLGSRRSLAGTPGTCGCMRAGDRPGVFARSGPGPRPGARAGLRSPARPRFGSGKHPGARQDRPGGWVALSDDLLPLDSDLADEEGPTALALILFRRTDQMPK